MKQIFDSKLVIDQRFNQCCQLACTVDLEYILNATPEYSIPYAGTAEVQRLSAVLVALAI